MNIRVRPRSATAWRRWGVAAAAAPRRCDCLGSGCCSARPDSRNPRNDSEQKNVGSHSGSSRRDAEKKILATRWAGRARGAEQRHEAHHLRNACPSKTRPWKAWWTGRGWSYHRHHHRHHRRGSGFVAGLGHRGPAHRLGADRTVQEAGPPRRRRAGEGIFSWSQG